MEGAAVVLFKNKKKKKVDCFSTRPPSQLLKLRCSCIDLWEEVAKWRIHFESVEAQRSGYLRT